MKLLICVLLAAFFVFANCYPAGNEEVKVIPVHPAAVEVSDSHVRQKRHGFGFSPFGYGGYGGYGGYPIGYGSSYPGGYGGYGFPGGFGGSYSNAYAQASSGSFGGFYG